MINESKNGFVARCVPLAAQHATNDGFRATCGCNAHATNNMKALASMVLDRNTQRNNRATDTQKTAQQIAKKNSAFVARSCAGFSRGSDTKKAAELLLDFAPPIRPIQCGNCTQFTPHHAHGKGSGLCKAGVMPSGLAHWSETQRTCSPFKPKQETSC